MNNRRLLGIALSLLVLLAFACSTSAQKTTTSAQPEGPPITVKGKIDYMTNLGGYFVRGVEPGGEFFIVNKDPKVLGELQKSGKTLTIEGRIARGAEYLFIEKIDGKPYTGKQQ